MPTWAVEGRGGALQPSEVLAHQNRQPAAARFDDAHSLAAVQVLIDRSGQAIGQPPQLQILVRKVEWVDLALAELVPSAFPC